MPRSEQVRVLPVTTAAEDYARQVVARLEEEGIRAVVDSGERIAKLIRTAEKAKTPVMLVVGAKEAEEGTVAGRLYQIGDVGTLKLEDMVARIVKANRSRAKNIEVDVAPAAGSA